MKFLRVLIAAVMLAALPCAVVTSVVLTGCQSPDAGLKSVGTVGLTVERVMLAAGDLHRAGKVTDAERDRIIAAHDRWIPLYRAALAVARQFPSSPPDAALTAATDELLNAARAARVPVQKGNP